MGYIVDTADCQKYMAGVERPGGAGAAGGSTDALVIQQKEKRFSFDPLKAAVHISGQTLFRVSVQGRVRNFQKSSDQAVPQHCLVCRVLVQMIGRLL